MNGSASVPSSAIDKDALRHQAGNEGDIHPHRAF
jgi:hypothetical protein